MQRTNRSSHSNPSGITAPQVHATAMPKVGPQSSAMCVFFSVHEWGEIDEDSVVLSKTRDSGSLFFLFVANRVFCSDARYIGWSALLDHQ